MYEYALYGQIAQNDHSRVLQQLTGLTRMPPQPLQQIHLVFRAQQPTGVVKIPSAGDASTKQDVQRIAKMLSANLYFVHVIGEVHELSKPSLETNGDATMSDAASPKRISWRLDFKDTPDPGKQAVSGRMVARIPIEDGNIVKFMKAFGYECVFSLARGEKTNESNRYVNRFMTRGHQFYDQDMTLLVHRIYRIPSAGADGAADTAFLDTADRTSLFDISGGYILQASIDADGSAAELKDRATSQLLAMKDTLKEAIALGPGDRLAMDMRAPARR
jgi:hypothetical protein